MEQASGKQPLRRQARLYLLIMCLAGALPGETAVASPLTGPAAFGGIETDAPGLQRLIRPGDLPKPYDTPARAVMSHLAGPAQPKVPPGFRIEKLAGGLSGARTLRYAPNGDLFIARSTAGKISVLHRQADGQISQQDFATGLEKPYGMAFYPARGPAKWLYVSTVTQVLRFAYTPGDLAAASPPEVVIDDLPAGGHTTRDLLFSADDQTLYVAVGSGSNVAEGDPQASHERRRAGVLAFHPDGSGERVFASGIRNCAGMALDLAGDGPWCAVNERDGLGDNLPPDYVTHVREGGFYGWPWYYIGGNPDPRHDGEKPELKANVLVPDVLFQPHSAPLAIAFNPGGQFPKGMAGSAFVTLHGSWNRSQSTGYKIVRLPMEHGRATGVYEDFVTGFASGKGGAVSGRPVGITFAPDGALVFSEDAGGTVWRVSYGRN